MSVTLQNKLNERRYGIVKNYDPNSFRRNVYADKFFISRLELERELSGHDGCVNTLDWSCSGDKLLTGSDDLKLNIYSAYEDFKLIETINTGHSANIFTAKFMPKTSDNIIVSGAGDSEIRIFDLNHSDGSSTPLEIMYVCHHDQINRICTFENNPYEFLTCSYDGTIRHFDRRQHHICSKHNILSFITRQSKPARQWPLPQTNRKGCPKPLVIGKEGFMLNALSISRLYPHYFAAAGGSGSIYLFDRRMMTASDASMKSQPYSGAASSDKPSQCVKRFSAPLGRRRDHLARIYPVTACKFSQSNGYELLGSWSLGDVYLFNINDSVIERSNKYATGIRYNDNINRIRGRFNSPTPSDFDGQRGILTQNREDEDSEGDIQRRKATWEAIHESFRMMKLEFALMGVNDLTQHLNNPLISISDFDRALGDASAAFMFASIINHRRLDRDNWYSAEDEVAEERSSENTTTNDNDDDWTIYFFEHELNRVSEKIQHAQRVLATIGSPQQQSSASEEQAYVDCWQIYWCLATGYWILKGGYQPIADCYRIVYLKKSLDYLERARESLLYAYRRELPGDQDTSLAIPSLNNGNHGYSNYVYLKMIIMFYNTVKATLNREERNGGQEIPLTTTHEMVSSGEGDPLSDEIEQYCPWEQLMYITLYDPREIEDFLRAFGFWDTDTARFHRPNWINSAVALASNLDNGIENGDNQNSENEDEQDDDNDDDDSDCEYLSFGSFGLFPGKVDKVFESMSDAGKVAPRKKYTGHFNYETVKDIDFFGLNDEYIVSGSDCGNLFIWDKKSTKIVQILKADDDVVNVARGHPTLPILAVSGIDSTAKIFTPTSKPFITSRVQQPCNPDSYSSSSRMYDRDLIVDENEANNRQRLPPYPDIDVLAAFRRGTVDLESEIVRVYLEDDDGSEISESEYEDESE